MNARNMMRNFLTGLKEWSDKISKALHSRMLQSNYNDAWEPWMKDRFLFVLKNYHLFDFRWRKSRRVVVYMTERSEVSGLADRLRTIRCAYVLAAESGRNLHVYHDKGFLLEDYLEPNEIDWRIKPEQISFGLNRVVISIFINQFQRLRKRKEYHIYKTLCVVNTEGFLPDNLKEKYSDHIVSRKLFKYSPRLVEMVESAMKREHLVENEYICVHVRFTNFFEKVETYGAVKSTEEQRLLTLRRVRATIEKIHDESECKKIVLLSDSNYFLQSGHADYVQILPGEVTHIAKEKEGHAIVDKTFLDLLIMAKSRTIYSITGEHIYGGGFAQDASFLENKPFRVMPLVV